ncbi:MAG: glycosyltransferase [Ignavibacteriaceae bacterium]
MKTQGTEESFVSVLMPVYNCGDFLLESILSILNQTYSHLELIIIDGGSNDNTYDIVKSFTDKRIVFLEYGITHLAKQLNHGLMHASGKYIARMDGDDASMPERLERQITFLDSNKNIHLVGTNYVRIDENGKFLFNKIQPEFHEQIEYMMTVMPSVLHPTIVTYKSILDELGGYPDLENSIIEDYDLYLLMLEKKYIFYNIQEYLLKYRLRKKSVGGLYGKKQANQIYAKSQKYLRKNYSNSKEEDILYFRLALVEYYLGDINKSRKFFLKSFLLNKKRIKRIIRYLPLLIFPNVVVKFLRDKGILYFISTQLNKYLNIDFFQFKQIHRIDK